MMRIVLLGMILCVTAFTTSPPSQLPSDIGIILLHGKRGSPLGSVSSLASSLRVAGYRVEAPVMPWAKVRFLDKSYSSSMQEIASAAVRLRAAGVKRIIVAGHSMGANAALGFAIAKAKDVSGLILMAAGHLVDTPLFKSQVADDLKRAQRAIELGKGNQLGTYTDLNRGFLSKHQYKASIYVSWYDPHGPAGLLANAKKLPPSIPVLWVAGTQDRVVRAAENHGIYRALSVKGNTRRVVVRSNHLNTPQTATASIILWLSSLNRTR